MTAVAPGGLALFSPPHRLAHDEELPLGAHVRYSHRAAVARWRVAEYTRVGMWLLTEGVPKRSGWRPALGVLGSPGDIDFGYVDDPFFDRPIPGVNKTVFVWPDEGEAVVVGLVRRGIGESYPASGGTGGMFDDSFEPGGFFAHAYVRLYALRWALAGDDYGLAPAWAVTPA